MCIEKIKPLKFLGQNFLKEQNIAVKIVDLLGDISDKNVIEIGPGMGILTELLLKKCKKITAFDIDERAIKYLKTKFANETNLEIIHSNILSINLDDYAAENLTVGGISLIGNIPYNITNEIIFWIFEQSHLLKTAVLTIQREVAERYIAKICTKEYGITTIAMQLYASAKIAFHIPPKAFFPAPKVTSSVIIIDFSEQNKFPKIDKKAVMKLVRASFSQRRKMLNNSLKQYMNSMNINQKKLADILNNSGKNYLKMRAEALTVSDFIDFYSLIKSCKNHK